MLDIEAVIDILHKVLQVLMILEDALEQAVEPLEKPMIVLLKLGVDIGQLSRLIDPLLELILVLEIREAEQHLQRPQSRARFLLSNA
jgi:hypothetical protein